MAGCDAVMHQLFSVILLRAESKSHIFCDQLLVISCETIQYLRFLPWRRKARHKPIGNEGRRPTRYLSSSDSARSTRYHVMEWMSSFKG